MPKISEVGRRPIAEVDRRRPVRVKPTTSLGDVVMLLRKHRRGAVLVEDESGLIGIFSERDVMKRIDHSSMTWRDTPVVDVMTKSPKTIRTNQTIDEAITLMIAGKYRHLPVIEDGSVIGILSIRDLLSHIVEYFPADFVNLPPKPQYEDLWGG